MNKAGQGEGIDWLVVMADFLKACFIGFFLYYVFFV
jgi:hypothetical protein